MAGRVTTVTLVAGKDRKAFPITVAETLLKMKNNGGWVLPENSEWQFNSENGTLNRRPNKASAGKSAAQDGTGKSAE